MIAPFANNSNYRLTSKFGKRNLGNGIETHNGIDFVSYYSKKVIAVDEGIVTSTITNSYNMDKSNVRGNLVKVKNSKGYTLYYQHLESVSVNVGDTIKIGDVLGIEGNTGRVWSANGGTGIHLHFEVRDPDNIAINPADLYDIYNVVGDYSPSDPFERETSDNDYVEEKENQDNVPDTKQESDIQYTSELNGKYEPIYPDLTSSPKILTKQYNKTIDVSNKLNVSEVKPKENNGIIPNNNEPYKVDNYIAKLESHNPNIVLNNVNVDRLKDSMPTETDENGNETGFSIQCKNKFLELIETIDSLSKSVEKRVVRLENIDATNTRYLHRLSSRIKVNCVYYGGQSVYDKYLCIRCLDDNLVNDTPVSLDQCLNCSRYEPEEGQVYEIEDKVYLGNSSIENAIIVDNSQASRESITNNINKLKPTYYKDSIDRISKKINTNITSNDNNIDINYNEVPLSEQKIDIAKYEIDNIISDTNIDINTSSDNIEPNTNLSDSFGSSTNMLPHELPILNSNNILLPSNRIIQVMADYESFAQYRYKDGLDPQTGKQMYSIGFGHQILDTDNLVEPITYQQALDLLANDALSKARIVSINIDKAGLLYNIKQCQLDALVCFTCSCGGRREVTNAAIDYMRNKTEDNKTKLYNAFISNGIYYAYYENGEKKTKLLQPLVERRKREFNIFTTGDYSK